MKKLLSILLALMMCFSMASAAFALDSSQSPQSPDSPQGGGTGGTIQESPKATDARGMSYELASRTLSYTHEVSKEVTAAGSAEKFVETIDLAAEVSKIAVRRGVAVSELKVHSVLDVYIKSGDPVFPVTTQIPLAGVKTSDVVILIHKATTGYEVIPAKVIKDGVVEAVFNSFSPIVALVSASKYPLYDKCDKAENCVLTLFSDLVPAEWYHDGIHYCVENGIMEGIGDGKFDPTGTTTRGMIITMLWRLQGGPVVDYAMTYTDVEENEWYTEAIRWATSVGVVEGSGDNHCDPKRPITRQELATMIYRYDKLLKMGGLDAGETYALDFPDVDEIADWAEEAMQWSVKAGIILGKGGKLDPKGDASRAEAATMLQRYCVK